MPHGFYYTATPERATGHQNAQRKQAPDQPAGGCPRRLLAPRVLTECRGFVHGQIHLVFQIDDLTSDFG